MTEAGLNAGMRAAMGNWLSLLREYGVLRFATTQHGFEIEFMERAEVAPPPAKPGADAERCPCGHHLAIAHVNGLCVEGCTEAECNPSPK